MRLWLRSAVVGAKKQRGGGRLWLWQRVGLRATAPITSPLRPPFPSFPPYPSPPIMMRSSLLKAAQAPGQSAPPVAFEPGVLDPRCGALS